MDHEQNSTTPAGGQGGIDHKSEWLEAIRYVSLPDHRSAIMKKESSGWELASSRFLTPGDLVTGYVNAPITPLFHQAERIFQKSSCFCVIVRRLLIFHTASCSRIILG